MPAVDNVALRLRRDAGGFQVETYYHVVDGRLDPEAAFDQTEEVWIDGWEIDGIVGPGTKAAMRAWFDAELKAAYPREINVVTEHPGAPMGYVMLDRDNTNGGVYHYQSGDSRDRDDLDEEEWWGLAPVVYAIERSARRWIQEEPTTIQVGDMSKSTGGDFPPHGSHNKGRVADVRPIMDREVRSRLEDAGLPTTAHFNDKNLIETGAIDSQNPARINSYLRYDRERSVQFLRELIAEAPKSRGVSLCYEVFCNDLEVSRCKPEWSVFHKGCVDEKGQDWIAGALYDALDTISQEHGHDENIVVWATGHHHHYHIKIGLQNGLEH